MIWVDRFDNAAITPDCAGGSGSGRRWPDSGGGLSLPVMVGPSNYCLSGSLIDAGKDCLGRLTAVIVAGLETGLDQRYFLPDFG